MVLPSLRVGRLIPMVTSGLDEWSSSSKRATAWGNRTRLTACSDIPEYIMFVFGNFLEAVAKVLDVGLTLYMWLIVGRAVISWVNADPYNPIVKFLSSATEPVLYQVRRRLPSLGGIDFSPVVVILAIIFIQAFLIKSLLQLATRLG